jgi:hypothetical protein
MAFARHQFELSKPLEDGTPLLAHLQSASEATGKLHPMIADAPSLPDGCKQLWSDFLELHGSRGSTGWGPARITYLDLFAWEQVNATKLGPWALDCVRKLDDVWLSEYAPRPKETKQ